MKHALVTEFLVLKFLALKRVDYASGFEHLEFALRGRRMFGNSELKTFMEKHPSLEFVLREYKKDINPAVSLKEALDGRPVTVKFHIKPLYEVVMYELLYDCVVKVPDNYWD